MKKMFLTLAIVVSTLGVFASPDDVNQQVLNAFNTEFASAKEVEWTVGSNYYKATFTYNEQRVFAYYDENGELLGLTRFVILLDLPLALQKNLKKTYPGYWISDLFEAAKNDGTNYYLTLENADSKIILKSSGNNWNTFSKIKKS